MAATPCLLQARQRGELTTVLDASSPGVEVGKPTHFTVFTKGAGKAKLDVHFAGATKGEVVRDFEIIDNHDYSYTVKYTAVQQVSEGLPLLAFWMVLQAR